MWTLFFLSLIPLILFAVLNYYKGLKTGVISGIIGSVVLLLYSWLYLNILDEQIVIMTMLLIVLGCLSIKKNQEVYFKMQPVLSSFIVVLIILWFELNNHSIFITITDSLINAIPPKDYAVIHSPLGQSILQRMAYHSMAWISIHALFLAWTAKYCRTGIWLLTKIFFLPFLLLMIIIGEIIIQFT